MRMGHGRQSIAGLLTIWLHAGVGYAFFCGGHAVPAALSRGRRGVNEEARTSERTNVIHTVAIIESWVGKGGGGRR